VNALAKIRNGALALAGLCLLVPAAAPAATVSVAEWQGPDRFETANFAELAFGAAAEDNEVTITVASEAGGMLRLRVLDARSGVAAGPGCEGGGAPGVPAFCTLHAPRGPEYVPAGFKGSANVPGTRWIDSMAIDLGDGTNALDASSLTGELDRSFAMKVAAGTGSDHIATGGGDDVVDPGAGGDAVSTGDGSDLVLATSAPDGADFYDLGSEAYPPVRYRADRVDYSARSSSVGWNEREAGAPGEGDELHGVEAVFGGSGDDFLEGNEDENFIVGGPGDDRIAGGSNWNELYGGPGDDTLIGASEPDRLIGGPGDDVSIGGAGADSIRDWDDLEPAADGDGGAESGRDLAFGGPGEDRIETGGAHDRARGGGGSDRIQTGSGGDGASGGTGRDVIDGGSGRDSLHGGSSGDVLVGDAGFDRLFGESGPDLLFSGRTTLHLPSDALPPSAPDGADAVACGDGRDIAFAEPRDRLSGCELRRLPRS
jgi:Ca2+-binding RTX toxin-like protein